MRLAQREGQIGQERLHLSGREDDRSTGLEACFKSAKKPELKARLGRQCSPTSPGQEAPRSMAQPSPGITPFSTVLATIRIRPRDTPGGDEAQLRKRGG